MSVPIKERSNYTKSCPGWAITKQWVIKQLNNNMSEKELYAISELRNPIEGITGKDYGKMDSEKLQKEAGKDLEEFSEKAEKIFRENTELKGKLEILKNKEPETVAVEKIVYKDTEETLKKLENKNQEVIDLKTALEKRSALYKLLLDAKRLLIKIWGLII